MTTFENHHSKCRITLWKEEEKEQAHSFVLMEKFCAVSNILGSILVNEERSCVSINGKPIPSTRRCWEGRQAWDGRLSGKPRAGKGYIRNRNYEVGQIHSRSFSSRYLNLLVLGVWFLIVQKFCEINFGNASFRRLSCSRTFLLRKRCSFSGQNLGQKEENSDRDGRPLCWLLIWGTDFSLSFAVHDFHICPCPQGLSLEFFLCTLMCCALVCHISTSAVSYAIT